MREPARRRGPGDATCRLHSRPWSAFTVSCMAAAAASTAAGAHPSRPPLRAAAPGARRNRPPPPEEARGARPGPAPFPPRPARPGPARPWRPGRSHLGVPPRERPGTAAATVPGSPPREGGGASWARLASRGSWGLGRTEGGRREGGRSTVAPSGLVGRVVPTLLLSLRSPRNGPVPHCPRAFCLLSSGLAAENQLSLGAGWGAGPLPSSSHAHSRTVGSTSNRGCMGKEGWESLCRGHHRYTSQPSNLAHIYPATPFLPQPTPRPLRAKTGRHPSLLLSFIEIYFLSSAHLPNSAWPLWH